MKICIPKIKTEVDTQHIFTTFCKLNIGYIESITESASRDPEFKRVFIKIKWNKTEKAEFMRKRLTAGEDIKLVYKMPWFWKLVEAI